MKTLVNVMKMENFNKIEMFQRGNTVHLNGDYPLPTKEEFDSFEEAKAFMRGFKWAVIYYGGSCGTYMKEVEI